MIIKDIEQLKRYAAECYLHSALPITEEQFIDVFCDGYTQALDSVVMDDVGNAQRLIDTAVSRAIPGTKSSALVYAWATPTE